MLGTSTRHVTQYDSSVQVGDGRVDFCTSDTGTQCDKETTFVSTPGKDRRVLDFPPFSPISVHSPQVREYKPSDQSILEANAEETETSKL